MKFGFLKNKLCIFFLFILSGGLYSACFPQEIYWDFAHYHYYNAWSFLQGRTFTDIAPAGVHSYFNPMMELPLYCLLQLFNTSSAVIFFYQGLWAGALWFLIFKFACMVLPAKSMTDKLGILTAVIFSCMGFAIVRQIGTSTSEIQLSVLFLTGMYLLCKSWFAEKVYSPKIIFWATLLLGISCGLKYTIIPMNVSFGLVCLVFYRFIPDFKKSFVLMFLGGVSGFLLVNGWWMWQLWIHFENPFFPFLNSVFQSPHMPLDNYRDLKFLPETIGMWLFYPFYWIKLNELVTDIGVKNGQFFLIYASVILMGIMVLLRRFKLTPFQLFTLCFWVLAYVFWMSLFSILRYGVVLEAFGGILVILTVRQLIKKEIVRTVFYAALFVYALFLPSGYGTYSTTFKPKTYAQIESLKIADDVLVVFYGSPVAIVGTGLQTQARYMGLQQSFKKDKDTEFMLFDKQKQKILANPDQKIVVIGVGEHMKELIVGLDLKLNECRFVYNTFYPTAYVVCPKEDTDGVIKGYKNSKINLHF